MESNIEEKDVLCVTTDERKINYKWEKDSTVIVQDPQLGVVSLTDIKEYEKKGIRFISQSRSISPGTILIRNPYDPKSYIDINMSEETLLKEKLNRIGQIIKCLGATKFHSKISISKCEERSLELNGQIKFQLVKMETSYQKKEESRYTGSYCRWEIFSGGYREEDYEEAKRIVQENKLDADFKYLINQRNPSSTNKITEQCIHINISNEFNSLIDCAFKLDVLHGIFQLRGNVRKTIKIKKDLLLKTEIKFQ